MNEARIKKPAQQLTAPQIVRFLTTEDEELDTLILCKSSEIQLDMSEGTLYTAIASLRPSDNIKLNKLAKLLEVTHVHHGHKHIVTHEMVEQVRKKALQKPMEEQ